MERKINDISDFHQFPFSPAHAEEIATPLMNPSAVSVIDRLEMAARKLHSISLISQDVVLLPSEFGPIAIGKENPTECFRRVVMQYHANPVVEAQERQALASFKNLDLSGQQANKISNFSDDFLIDSDYGRSLTLQLYLDRFLGILARDRGIKCLDWENISGEFRIIERALELAMLFLEKIRYRPESVGKSRSRMHDVTHSIYASRCEKFITNDARLYHKAKAVYRYFGIPTDVLMLDDFLVKV